MQNPVTSVCSSLYLHPLSHLFYGCGYQKAATRKRLVWLSSFDKLLHDSWVLWCNQGCESIVMSVWYWLFGVTCIFQVLGLLSADAMLHQLAVQLITSLLVFLWRPKDTTQEDVIFRMRTKLMPCNYFHNKAMLSLSGPMMGKREGWAMFAHFALMHMDP